MVLGQVNITNERSDQLTLTSVSDERAVAPQCAKSAPRASGSSIASEFRFQEPVLGQVNITNERSDQLTLISVSDERAVVPQRANFVSKTPVSPAISSRSSR
uniref:Uncharacterized protein n=1 Tax=Anopheles culicifacies TaxID=139723 RepID=A0A182MNV4_9DIPT